MQASDWIDGLARLGPYIVALAGVIMWGLKNRSFSEQRRQTELLARIAAKSEKA